MDLLLGLTGGIVGGTMRGHLRRAILTQAQWTKVHYRVRFRAGTLAPRHSRRHLARRHRMQSPVWIKPAVWGVVIGSVGTMMVGFTSMGWTLNTTAQRMAQERADVAVTAA